MGINLDGKSLFGEKVIKSINYNETELIKHILYLHAHEYIELDPTFSVGNLYKDKLPLPKYKFDKYPQRDDVIEALSNNLPLENESISTIMFDPPFLIGGVNYMNDKEGSSIIAKRFTSFKDFNELKEMYFSSLKEFKRVLKEDGIIIFKCQDCVSSGKNHFTHNVIINMALFLDLYVKDLFILLAKNRLLDGREQKHARKYHSYFLVIQKTSNKINYGF